MTQSKVWGCDKKVAKRALRDAAETGFALSPDEAEALRLAVVGDPKCYELGLDQVMSAVWDRNPRADLYMARAQAKQLLEYRDKRSFISHADLALLHRASRATDVTSQQIDEIRARYYAARYPFRPSDDSAPEPYPHRAALGPPVRATFKAEKPAGSVSSSGQPEATGRLQRALEAFQKTQSVLLATHRKLKGLPAEEVERFWAAQGHQIEHHTQAAAVEVAAAFDAFSVAGLVASANDRHLITEARRIVAEGKQ